MLLEDRYLMADISLPHGVFKPYASVKTHILVIDRPRARRANDVLFLEIENDGFTQTDTREPIEGSQLSSALSHLEAFKKAIDFGTKWKPPDLTVRSYTISKNALLASKGAHLLGRWHDLPDRVLHRPDIPLMRLGDICVIRNGLSPNEATPPGEYTMVVPAEERKTADHFDFEGAAVCIPLVSSSGHGKADIKRLHYQDGEFALASTMAALFVRDSGVILPRYLFILLSAMSTELLVPLMRGATNVTMNIEQLADVVIPVPEVSLQAEVVESELIGSTVSVLRKTAQLLVNSSKDQAALDLANVVLEKTHHCLSVTQDRKTIRQFLPN